MEIKKIRTEELKPAAYNPRKALKPGDAEYKKIQSSIMEFGYVDPLIVNSDMTIIGGHQRFTVLKDLGFEEIECVIVDFDKDREKALNIALNKISGEWDMPLLKDLLTELDNGFFNVELTGFDMSEIESLMTQYHVEEETPKQREDLSNKVKSTFEVIVECENESELEDTFNKLTEEGYNCRVLTL